MECKRLVTLIYFRNHRFDLSFDFDKALLFTVGRVPGGLFFAHATAILVAKNPCKKQDPGPR
jgi:hypothetical protein